jgi:DNA-binding XRE family transcriptional regulator
VDGWSYVINLTRKCRKLGNAAIAGRAGVSRATVYKVEAGDHGAF